MGQRLVIVPLPWSDVSQSLRSGCGQLLRRYLCLRVGFSYSSESVGVLLSDPVAPSLEETSEVPMRIESSGSLHGLSSD